MQANYPKKYPCPEWDGVNLEYTVKKFPSTGVSSYTIGHEVRNQPEVLRDFKPVIYEAKNHSKDFDVLKGLTRSQTNVDFGFKLPETKRFNKHTSSSENHYIYPLLRRISERPPACHVHGTTEMRSAYVKPAITPRIIITNKNQYKNPMTLPDPNYQEPSFVKELAPLDTTYDGFEKYLDPYLTTSRLEFRPHTADQLEKPSNSNNILTYYSYANIPWTRTPGSKGDQKLPFSKAKPIYDRDKFQEGFREIRVPNEVTWVPGSFRTESRDHYKQQESFVTKIPNFDGEVSEYRNRQTSKLSVSHPVEQATIRKAYFTENQHYGSGRAISSVIDQCKEKNKKLERQLSRKV